MKLDNWLNRVLENKEQRVKKQEELRLAHGSSLLSLTINIPGRIKDGSEAKYIYDIALKEIDKFALHVKEKVLTCKETGYEAIYAIEIEASELKALTCKLEESHSLGRFMDIDVIDKSGNILSRQTPRRCYICEKSAKECARNQTHDIDELLNFISKAVDDYKSSL